MWGILRALFGGSGGREVSATEVRDRLSRGEIVLIDLREPSETRAEAVAGAHLVPLSSFDPRALPIDPARPIVFYCATGRRSLVALARCTAAGLPDTAHMRGGLAAWKAAGLPTAPGGSRVATQRRRR